MKKSKFSDAQKAFILKQGEESVAVAEICRKVGVRQATYFNWKKKFGGMLPFEVEKLRELWKKRTVSSRSWLRICLWTRPCYRTLSNESSKA